MGAFSHTSHDAATLLTALPAGSFLWGTTSAGHPFRIAATNLDVDVTSLAFPVTDVAVDEEADFELGAANEWIGGVVVLDSVLALELTLDTVTFVEGNWFKLHTVTGAITITSGSLTVPDGLTGETIVGSTVTLIQIGQGSWIVEGGAGQLEAEA